MRLIKVIIIFATIWAAGFWYFISLIPKEKTLDDPSSADAIIVLTGGGKRIETGFHLLEKQKSAKLFITGVNDRIKSLREVSNFYNNLRESDREKIELGWEAENTAENALEAKGWVEKNQINSIILVTSNYHMPRSLLEFRKTLPSTVIKTYPVFSSKVKVNNWWDYPGTTLLLLKEYNKCLFLLAYEFIQKLKR